MAQMKVRIAGDSSQFRREMRGVESAAQRTGTAVRAALGMAGVSVGIAGLARAVNGLIEAGDKVDKGRQRLGVTAEAYQRIAHMAELSGTSIEAVEASFSRMNRVVSDAERGMATAQHALSKLSLTAEDLRGKKPDEMFALIARRLKDITDESKRSATAQEIFGRGGAQLLPMIQSFEDLHAAAAEIPVITDEAAAAAARFSDQMTTLGQRTKAAIANSGLLEWLDDVADKLSHVEKDFQLSDFAEAFKKKSIFHQFIPMGQVANFLHEKADVKPPDISSQMSEAITADQLEEAAWRQAVKRSEELAQAERKRRAEEAALAEAARIEQEKADAEAAKLAERQAMIKSRISEDMVHQLRLQKLINDEMEREASIEDAVFRAKRAGAELTEAELDKIREMAGELYDLRQRPDSDDAADAGTFKIREHDQTTMLERIGAIMGGGRAQDPLLRMQTEQVRLAKESLQVQREILIKTGDAMIGVA